MGSRQPYMNYGIDSNGIAYQNKTQGIENFNPSYNKNNPPKSNMEIYQEQGSKNRYSNNLQSNSNMGSFIDNEQMYQPSSMKRPNNYSDNKNKGLAIATNLNTNKYVPNGNDSPPYKKPPNN